MQIRMGEKIRRLRREKGMSQEVLEQILGVSFQAVSKWETGATLPDVAMIPALASYFGVSTDELFDFDRTGQEEKVMQLCRAAAEFRFSDPARSEAMLREGLRQYPGNEVILNNLLYTMQTPERSDEVVRLCRSILEVTKYDDMKYDALRILARTYHEMGQQALVKPTLEQIPEIYFSKLELEAKLLEGEEALEAARLQAGLSRDDLLEMLARMCELYREKGDAVRSAQYAALTRQVYALFENADDGLGYDEGRRREWLAEDVWLRIEKA